MLTETSLQRAKRERRETILEAVFNFLALAFIMGAVAFPFFIF